MMILVGRVWMRANGILASGMEESLQYLMVVNLNLPANQILQAA